MTSDNKKILKSILDDLDDFPYVSSADIPGISLYMDQVTTFMEERLSPTRRNREDKLLTKTMINNYTKNKLLPAPEKKKYNRDQMLILVFIYYLKGLLSLGDIQALLTPLTEKFYKKRGASSIEEIYKEVFSRALSRSARIREDVEECLELSEAAFEDASGEDQEFLKLFTLVSALATDVYIKKRVIEQLIDSYSGK